MGSRPDLPLDEAPAPPVPVLALNHTSAPIAKASASGEENAVSGYELGQFGTPLLQGEDGTESFAMSTYGELRPKVSGSWLGEALDSPGQSQSLASAASQSTLEASARGEDATLLTALPHSQTNFSPAFSSDISDLGSPSTRSAPEAHALR